MYYLIETQDQVEKFFKTEQGSCYIDVISDNNSKHPTLQNILAIFIYSNIQQKAFILNITHPEAFTLSNALTYLQQYDTIYVRDSVYTNILIPNNNYINIQVLYWLYYNNTLEEPPHIGVYQFFKKKYQNKNINQFIPLAKHYEYCLNYYNSISEYINLDHNIPEYNWYMQNVLPSISYLSQIGIKTKNITDYFDIDTNLSMINDQILGWYNIFTTTGRPINSFNKVRFSSLNHKNGERKCLIPSNDFFIEIDFEGYHPRIIAHLIGYEINKNESIHTQLAKMYFETKEIDDEMYKKSKELTFRQMYGGIDKEYYKYEFFAKTKNFIDILWQEFNTKGYVETFFAKRKIAKHNHKEMNPQKLFNYYIQAFETEYNMILIKKVINYLKNKKSKIVLYVYDSLLIDFSYDDGKSTFKEIENIFSADFPVKVKWGSNYDSLMTP